MIIIKRATADLKKEDIDLNLKNANLLESPIKSIYFTINKTIQCVEKCTQEYFYEMLEYLNANYLPAMVYVAEDEFMVPMFVSDKLCMGFVGLDVTRYSKILDFWLNCRNFIDDITKDYLLRLIKMTLKSVECVFTLDISGEFVIMNTYSMYEYAGITYSMYGKPYFGAQGNLTLYANQAEGMWSGYECWD